MPRRSRLLTRRRVKFTLVFVLAFTFFQGRTPPRPVAIVATINEASRYTPDYSRNVAHVSDDGRHVVCEIYISPMRPLERWDTHTGTNVTPDLWSVADFDDLLSGTYWRDTGLMAVLSHPTGEEFLRDSDAWNSLDRRFRTLRTPSDVRVATPRSIRFGADGRLIGYDLRYVRPTEEDRDDRPAAVAIEEIRTGRRIATLPGSAWVTAIAPGGRTAVTGGGFLPCAGKGIEHVLWDLETGTERARLAVPATWLREAPRYTSDGRFVFGRYPTYIPTRYGAPQYVPGDDLWWWDTTTGCRVGAAVDVGAWALRDGGRTLLVSEQPGPGQSADAVTFHAWDVATGTKTGLWDFTACRNRAGTVDGLVAAAEGRWLALTYEPDRAGAGSRGIKELQQWVDERFPEPTINTRARIIVLDADRQREVARLPGKSAAFSRYGTWLATIDAAGVLRIYEMPLRKPWRRILLYAALTTLGAWAVGWVIGRLRQSEER